METLEFYNLDSLEKVPVSQTSKIGDQPATAFEDLDPSLELAVDLREYIRNTEPGDLFSDIFPNQFGGQSSQIQRTLHQSAQQSMPHSIPALHFPTSAAEGSVIKVEPTSSFSTVDFTSLLSDSTLIVPSDFSAGMQLAKLS